MPFLTGVHDRCPSLSARSGWLLYTLACFLLFLLWTFPSDLLLQRLVQSLTRDSTVHVHYLEGNVTWWGGCEFHRVTIADPTRGLPELAISRLSLSPSLLGLLRTHPFPLGFEASVYDGFLSGTVQPAAEGFSLQFAGHHLALERWPFPAPWDRGHLTGRISAVGELQGHLTTLRSVAGSFRATLSRGALRSGTVAGLPVPALQGIQAQLRATLARGRLEITTLRLKADNAEINVQGAIVLRTPLSRSRLDLQLTTKTSGSSPAVLTTLLSLLPASPSTPGERRAVITGSLAVPVVR